MIVILGIDALEYKYVKAFECKNLMQNYYGKTDLSDYSDARTMVLWSSFLSGKNQEKRILSMKNFWEFRLKESETFFSHFSKYSAIDVPGFTQEFSQHEKEREMMKKYFDGNLTIEEYDREVLEYHKKIKERFFEELEKDYDIVMAYFNAADVIGHLSFGIPFKMKIIYKEMDEIAKRASSYGKMLVFSDHGMKAVGRYGDHSMHGFWSLPFDASLDNPKPTDFYEIIINKELWE